MQRLVLVDAVPISPMGWVTTPATHAALVACIGRIGYAVEQWATPDLGALHARLETAAPDALYWPNTYDLPDPWTGRPTSVVAALEARGLTTVGCGAEALRRMQWKHVCQPTLVAAGVPVPDFAVVDDPAAPPPLPPLPVVVKPSGASSSKGIDPLPCATVEAAHARIRAVAARFPGPVMVECFLPGADLTVAMHAEGDGWRWRATTYHLDDHPWSEGPVSEAHRERPWGDDKRLEAVRDPAIRAQIDRLVPRIAAAFGARDIVRFDGRLDAEGRLRIFDVNGLPGLDPDDCVLVQQRIAEAIPETRIEALDVIVGDILAAARARQRAAASIAIAPEVDPPRLFASR